MILLGLIAISCVQATFRNLSIAEFIQEADKAPITDTLAFFVNSKGLLSRRFLDSQLNRTVTDLNLVFPGLHIVLLDKQHRGNLKISDPLFTRFGVVDFPSAALFINGIKIEFTGRLKSPRLIAFVNRRYNSAPVPISDILALDQLPAERLLFFYYSEDATLPQLARGLASKFARSQFVHLMRKDIVDGFAARYGFTPQPWNHSILLSRRPQDGTYRQLSLPKEERKPLLRKVIRFIVQSSKLPSQHFTEHSAQEIAQFLRYGKAVMFFYFDPTANKTQAELIADFAEKNYRRMLARFISPDNVLGRESG